MSKIELVVSRNRQPPNKTFIRRDPLDLPLTLPYTIIAKSKTLRREHIYRTTVSLSLEVTQERNIT